MLFSFSPCGRWIPSVLPSQLFFHGRVTLTEPLWIFPSNAYCGPFRLLPPPPIAFFFFLFVFQKFMGPSGNAVSRAASYVLALTAAVNNRGARSSFFWGGVSSKSCCGWFIRTKMIRSMTEPPVHNMLTQFREYRLWRSLPTIAFTFVVHLCSHTGAGICSILQLNGRSVLWNLGKIREKGWGVTFKARLISFNYLFRTKFQFKISEKCFKLL